MSEPSLDSMPPGYGLGLKDCGFNRRRTVPINDPNYDFYEFMIDYDGNSFISYPCGIRSPIR